MSTTVMNELTQSDDLDTLAANSPGPGLLILSTTLQLIYSDRRAWDICKRIQSSSGKTAAGVLPPPVTQVCEEVVKHLAVRTDVKDWEDFRVKRVVGDPQQPIFLCGFGLPTPVGGKSRVLIILEDIGPRQDNLVAQAKTRFGFTEREIAVLNNLMKGWTNKEIANALTITEQTVKEHIKHIMAKTGMTTRTGILVKVLGV